MERRDVKVYGHDVSNPNAFEFVFVETEIKGR
jgi:hypothetical protein